MMLPISLSAYWVRPVIEKKMLSELGSFKTELFLCTLWAMLQNRTWLFNLVILFTSLYDDISTVKALIPFLGMWKRPHFFSTVFILYTCKFYILL